MRNILDLVKKILKTTYDDNNNKKKTCVGKTWKGILSEKLDREKYFKTLQSVH